MSRSPASNGRLRRLVSAFLMAVAVQLLPSASGAAPGTTPPVATAERAVYFNGVNQEIDTGVPGSAVAGQTFSVEFWFKGTALQSAVRLQILNNYIVAGWRIGQPANQPVHLVNNGGGQVQVPVCPSTANVHDGAWHHLALTWKAGSNPGFISFYDGRQVAVASSGTGPFPVVATNFYIGNYPGGVEWTTGALDEVRIWNRVLSAEEILDHATLPQRRLQGTEAGLVGYFPMNDGETNGTRNWVTGQLAAYHNMSATNRIAQTLAFVDPPGIVRRNPSAAGLWRGQVSLNAVNEAFAGKTNVQKAGGQFDMPVLLHVNAAGEVRLLKDVTLMQKRNVSSNTTQVVLVTEDGLLPNFDGLVKRNGRLVGIRHSSPFHTFEGTSLPLDGGLGQGLAVVGTNTMPTTLPTHPFRHLYHPVHKDPKDLKGQPYLVQRAISMGFRTIPQEPGEGRDLLVGTYHERISGLHRADIHVEGTLRLERVSLVSNLNDR